jgi:exodeoxyribonuclease VII large subunit
MPAQPKIFSLLEVTRSIQKTLSERYSSSFWVKAEMNKLNSYPHSGHCYPDLVEKKDGKVIAQIRSTLWKDDYFRINHNFLRVVKTPLKDGINMLFCARINFDPVHGLSLNIIDIDPSFSLGELEREKQETIEKLKNELIFDRNKSVELPLVPKRIAIISVQTSKGYADFQNVIGNNNWGYTFFHVLFPSLLQGEKAVDSILYQLNRIRKVVRHFDVVAIIRGGGGEVGLSCFNDYSLSREIALFPIPVITGIGHATNETVVEMIAHKNAITPTDLANYLIERFHEFAGPVHQAEEIIVDKAKRMITEERLKFRNTAKYFRSVTENILIRSKHSVSTGSTSLIRQTNYRLQQEKELQASLMQGVQKGTFAFCHHRKMDIHQYALSLKKDIASLLRNGNNSVTHMERSIANMSPENVLRRGYSMTLVNGKAVKSIADVKPSDILKTVLINGTVVSEVKAVNKTNDE